MKNILYCVIFALMSVAMGLFVGGCDIGTNPLIFDGTTGTSFRVDASTNVFPPLVEEVNLEDVLSTIEKSVDSISMYNITLWIDSASGTAAGTTLSGSLTLNSTNVFSMTNTPISAFASERSIFDPKLAAQGFTYGPNIVATMKNLLDQDPKPTVTITLSGSSSSNPHFTVHIKIYTQVYTKP